MMVRTTFSAAALAASLSGSALWAQDTPARSPLSASIAKCAAIRGDRERLICYDALSTKAALKSQPTLDVAGTGKWQVQRDRNPIDDTERVVIALLADKGKGMFRRPVVFVGRCQSNKTEAYIEWHNVMGSDSGNVYRDWKYVTVRIGGAKAQRQRWNVSTDKTGTFAPGWAGDLLKQMAQADRFIAQVTPFSESPVTAVFDTRGMTAALKPLAKACGWSLEKGSAETAGR